MPPRLVSLDVSGCIYRTHEATLQASPYFRNLMARWKDCCDRQEDGSFFVDANPDVFQHILNFMRRPSKFPLFWTKNTGFDYALYNNLEAEADYFLLNDLRDWIRQKRYLDAVRITIERITLKEYELLNGRRSERSEADIEVQSFFGSYSGERRYCCPLGIHSDDTKCSSNECMKITKAHGPHFHDSAKKLTMVIKTTRFIETMCTNDTVS
jgi:hypothetical protein